MPPQDLIRIDDDNSYLASTLRHPKWSLAKAVPDDLAPHQALANIRELVGGLNRVGNVASTIGVLLGAHLALCRKRPEIYESAYASLAEFEKAEIIDKISHGSVWNWKRVSETFPDATVGQLLEAGSTNLLRGAKALPPDASPKQREEFLEKAAELNTAQYTAWVESSGLSAPGETTTSSFTIIGNTSEIVELKEKLAEEHLMQLAEHLLGNRRSISVILAALAAFTAEEVPPEEQHEDAEKIQTGAAEEGWG